jgi:hypothetical protein
MTSHIPDTRLTGGTEESLALQPLSTLKMIPITHFYYRLTKSPAHCSCNDYVDFKAPVTALTIDYATFGVVALIKVRRQSACRGP